MLNSHGLEFLYGVHLNMTFFFFILIFYHIPNLLKILLINYKMLHDHLISNQLIMQHMAVTQIS